MALPTFAGPPAPFDQWVVTNGTVGASCAGNFKCSVLNTGPGFMQQQVTDPTTKLTYVQTIVTGPNESGAPSVPGLSFSSENYVRTGTFDPAINTNQAPPPSLGAGSQTVANGISSQQRLHAESNTATSTGIFDSLITINTGWAKSNATSDVRIEQKVSETGNDGTQFVNNAVILGNNDNSGVQTGTSIFLDTLMSQPKSTASDGTSSGGSGWGSGWGGGGSSGGGSTSSNPDVQLFVLRRVGGNMLNTAGRATLAGRTVTWQPGDVVQTVWLGQGFDFGSFGGSGVMGFQSFDNLSDAVSQLSTSSTSSTGPFTWVDGPLFGPRPVMPANGGSGSGGGGGGGGW